MAAHTSVAWERLMAAPWGKWDTASKKAKTEALDAYKRDWDAHPANPKNQRRVFDDVTVRGYDIEVKES